MECTKEIQDSLDNYYKEVIGEHIIFKFKDGEDFSDYMKSFLYDEVMDFCKKKSSTFSMDIVRDRKPLQDEETAYVRYMSSVMRNYIGLKKSEMFNDRNLCNEILKPYYREKKLNNIL